MFTLAQIKSLFAGFICMIVYGCSYIYGNIIPYATSFLYYKGDQNISASQMATLLPVSILVLNIGMPMINIKAIQFTNRKTALTSVFGISLCVFTMSFATQFWNYIVLYGILFGMFVGFGYMAPIKNCYQHIPNRKGLCTGVCKLGMGISALVFNRLLTTIINPDNQSPYKLDDGRNMYPINVVNNLPKALMIMSGVYLGLGLIGIMLMHPPSQFKGQSLKNVDNDMDNGNQIIDKSSDGINQIKQKVDLQKSLISDQNDDTFQARIDPYTCKYLISRKIHLQCLTLVFSVPFGLFIAFNYKEYGLTKITDDSFLTNVGSVGAIFSGCGRLFFGAIFDKFSFKVASSIINSGLLVLAISIPYLIQNQWLFMFGISATYFFYGGNFAIYPAHTARIFGSEVGSRVYFIPYLGFTLGSMIQLMFRWIFVSESNKFQDFKFCFYIFSGFNLISLLMSIFIKYDYLELKTNQKIQKQKQQDNIKQ